MLYVTQIAIILVIDTIGQRSMGMTCVPYPKYRLTANNSATCTYYIAIYMYNVKKATNDGQLLNAKVRRNDRVRADKNKCLDSYTIKSYYEYR